MTRPRADDTVTGRWLSHDPLGFGGGDLNLYNYAHGNPVMGNDPGGKWSAWKAIYTGNPNASDEEYDEALDAGAHGLDVGWHNTLHSLSGGIISNLLIGIGGLNFGNVRRSKTILEVSDKKLNADAVLPNATATSVPLVSSGRLAYIDGFRGLAILLVLLYHAWEGAHNPVAYWWNPLGSGYAGVTLFLLLSGFCLYWPLVKPANPVLEPTLVAFARRRAHRILPPYFIILGLITVIASLCCVFGKHWPFGPEGGIQAILTSVVWHVFMLQNLRPEYFFTLDGPMWSLALEVSLYVAMPLLVVVARLRGIGGAVGLAAIVTLTYRFFVDRFVGGAAGWSAGDPATNFVLVNFLPGQWLTFALGMLSATLIARNTTAQSRVPFTPLALVSLAGAAYFGQHWTRYNPISDTLYGVGFFLLILQVSRPPASLRTGVNRFVNAAFRWPALVWLGEISYSVYLIHYPLFRVVAFLSPIPVHHDIFMFVANLLYFIPIVGLAYVFHLYCERPFMNIRRKPTISTPISQEIGVPGT